MSKDPIGKLQNVVTRTTAAIWVKTSVFVGSAKIRTLISTLHKEINDILFDLGSMMYDMCDKGDIDMDSIIQQCRAIQCAGKEESFVNPRNFKSNTLCRRQITLTTQGCNLM